MSNKATCTHAVSKADDNGEGVLLSDEVLVVLVVVVNDECNVCDTCTLNASKSQIYSSLNSLEPPIGTTMSKETEELLPLPWP